VADVAGRFDAFLSYARDDDRQFRDELRAALGRAGLSLWYDRDLLANRGTTFDQEIRRAIESSDRLLLVVEAGALASAYVAQEWGFADDTGLPIVPILRAGTFDDLPVALRSNHSVDARPPRAMEEIVAEVVRLLSVPTVPLGTLHFVPGRHANELSRPQLLDSVSTSLGLDRQRPRDAGRAPRVAALYGISGSGKATVAAAFARATRSRRAFPAGTVWLTCGPSFDPLTAARTLLGSVAAGARMPAAPEDVQGALAAAIGTREVLIVLEDVRDADAVAPFIGALGPGGRALATTLDQEVASGLGAVEIAVHPLDDRSARQLLEAWTGGTLPPEADDVVAACDGLPFALALVGAMVHNRVPWASVAKALEGRRLDLIASRGAGGRYPNLLKALGAAYDALRAGEPAVAQCYLQLAALKPGAALTESVMVRLWSRAGGTDTLEASLVVPALERRLMLRRRQTPDGERFFLHGLHEDFVRLECPNAASLEAALVASYKADRAGADWSSLEDDGYVYQNLIAHLASTGAREDIVSAVNADWVRRQLLRSDDLAQALADVRLAMGVAARSPIDVVAVAALCLLVGRIAGTLRAASPTVIAALARSGEGGHALRWAADQPDAAQRFESLCLVAEALIETGETPLARKVVAAAAETIPYIGGTVETGMFAGLTALNAVHALVDFPAPDEWEGTSPQYVAQARIPLEAVVRLAPIAQRVDAVADVAAVRHPFWELYAHLLPFVAAEDLADDGQVDLAKALLAVTHDDYDDDSDMQHAGAYRRAVATAAVGQFDQARAAIEKLPPGYRPVGYRGLARHLAASGQAAAAVKTLEAIDDDTVASAALTDVIEATIDTADAAACSTVADLVMRKDWVVAATWLLAAGGDAALGERLVLQAPKDDLRLGLGTRLGTILANANRTDDARRIVAQLAPAAERLLGPQWFAPETIGVEPQLAALGRSLLHLVAIAGAPLPDGVTPLSLVFEAHYESVAPFKLELIVALAMAKRFSEATKLANVSSAPGGVALGLATALSIPASGIGDTDRQAAVSALIQAIEGIHISPDLASALGAVMRVLTSHEHDDDARRLAEALMRHPEQGYVIGTWALDRAKRGNVEEVRRFVRRLLVDAPLTVASPQSRALLLTAFATRHADTHEELDAVTTLLADPAIAASSLDIVFTVVGLHASQNGMQSAAAIARSLAGGSAGDIVERALSSEDVTWSDRVTGEQVAVSAAARAVASASMAVAAEAATVASEWSTRAESLVKLATEVAPALPVASATAKYLAAARVVAGSDALADSPVEVVDVVTRLLWERGRSELATRIAAAALRGSDDPLEGAPRIMSVEEFGRRHGSHGAARAGLEASLAMSAAAQGDLGQAATHAESANRQSKAVDWSELTLAERAESHAGFALGLARAGRAELATAQFIEASADALLLARRGELAPFGRLTEALVDVLKPDDASAMWSRWLISAGEAGASQALTLIANYVRSARDLDVSGVTVNVETGELRRRT
jgi:TIR domain/NB-ARC domain